MTILQTINLSRSGNPPTKITGQSQGETERREKVGEVVQLYFTHQISSGPDKDLKQ